MIRLPPELYIYISRPRLLPTSSVQWIVVLWPPLYGWALARSTFQVLNAGEIGSSLGWAARRNNLPATSCQLEKRSQFLWEKISFFWGGTTIFLHPRKLQV